MYICIIRTKEATSTKFDHANRTGLCYHDAAMWLKILAVSLLCFVVNIPLGRLRERSRKFSWQWILWVHASIPLIIALRIGLQLYPVAIPINIAAAVLGQVIGAAPEKRKRKALSPSAS